MTAGEARDDALERERARARAAEERAARLERDLEACAARLAEEAAVAASGRALAAELEGAAESPQAPVREAVTRTAELLAANEAMARTTARLGKAGDLRSFLDQVSLEVAATTRADSVGLALIEDGYLRSPTASLVLDGRLVPPDPLALAVPLDEAPFLELLAAERRPRSFDLEREAHLFWPGAVALHRAEGHRRVVSTALWVGDEVVGILAVAFRREAALDDSQLALLQALATQAALAVRLTRLAEEALQASVVRERERARAESAETHVALLQAANDALRRGTEQVGQHGGLEALLGAFLLEAMQVSGASGGGITEWRDGRFSKHLAIAQDGELVPFEHWRDEPMILETAEVLGRDNGGFATALLSQPILCSTLEDARSWWPAAAEYHARRGHVEVWNVPCTLRGRLLAHLGLAFRKPREMDGITVSTLTSLAQQMTLALELTYLGDAARQAAIEMETARAVAAERSRMAGEIHDSLAQAFTSIALQTEALLSEVGDDSSLRESLSVVEETARIGLAEARSSVLALRPVGARPGDLELALESLASRCTIPGTLSCRFRRGSASCPLSADARDAVLRVAQEAVANALRHARATEVEIHYEAVDGWVKLSVRDDGVGIENPPAPERAGLGVAGMRARAAALGGTLTLEAPSDGVGTEVRLSIPADAPVGKTAPLSSRAPGPLPTGSHRTGMTPARSAFDEAVYSAEERAQVVDQAMSAMRRCASLLADAREAAAVTVEALRAAVEVLAPQGVLSAGVVEHVASRHVLKFRAFIDGGVELSLKEPILARETSMDDPRIVRLWQRIVNESFIWGLTSDESVLHPDYRPWHESAGAAAVVYVPLRRGESVIGFVGFTLRAVTAPSRRQRELIEALASLVSLALEMNHLAEQAKQAAVDRETGRAIAAERSRMAGEIHDSLAQAFTSIALQTEALLSEVGEESPLRESLSVVEETARIGLAEARSSVLALRPVGDKPGDLELALESLANRCTIPGTLACSFRSGRASCPLSADARDAALRVAQEAVANALRNAKATRVDIHYEAVDGWMNLCIRDDGVGIHDEKPSARSGVGLPGMRARAVALGGTLVVKTAPDGRGTEVCLSTPADARAVTTGAVT